MTEQTNFTSSFPLDFNLLNSEMQSVAFIATAAQTLTLQITNASASAMIFAAPAAAEASASSYHLKLDLRPGTLAPANADQSNLPTLAAGGDWSMAQDANSLYLQLNAATTLQPGGLLSVDFGNVFIDPAQGARVTQVQISSDQMAYQETPDAVVQFSRTLQLSIINQRGNKNIPLHVGWVGSNTVLNDGGTANSLQLRITNLSPSSDPGGGTLSFPAAANSDSPASFKLSYISSDDAGVASEDALGSSAQLANITIAQPSGWAVEVDDQSVAAEWTIAPSGADYSLAPGGYIDLTISNLICDAPTGTTYLRLDYFNVPGYWDGEFLVPVQKQPLVLRDQGVGIGTADIVDADGQATAGLRVKGLIKTDTPYIDTAVQTFRVEGDPGTYYPVVWQDDALDRGALHLEVLRPDVNADSQNLGTLSLQLTAHVGDNKDPLSYWDLFVQQSLGTFVAKYQNLTGTARYCIWLLGGGITYAWKSNHPASLVDNSSTNTSSTYYDLVQTTIDMAYQRSSYHLTSRGELVPQGMIVMWSGPAPLIPTGWALCDGQNNTPDLRSRFVIGASGDGTAGSNLTPRMFSWSGGQETVALTEDELPAHTHTVDLSGDHDHNPIVYHANDFNFSDNYSGPFTTGTDDYSESMPDKSLREPGLHTHTVQNTGGDKAHDNMPPWFALAYIMKIS